MANRGRRRTFNFGLEVNGCLERVRDEAILLRLLEQMSRLRFIIA
jgi:hypothetical protein